MLNAFAYKLIRCLIPLLIVTVFGQDAFGVNIRRKHTPSGNFNTDQWSFQAAIDESFDDDDYHGLRLSVSHHYSKSAAIRFNFGIVGKELEYRTGRVIYSHGEIVDFEYDRDFDLTGVNFGLQFLSYPVTDGRLRFFWGLGPRLSINESDEDFLLVYESDYYSEWYSEISCDNCNLVGLGLESSFGLEWFLGRNVSLLAEYGLILQKEWYVFDFDTYDQYGHRTTEWETIDNGTHFDASRIKLGVAVYF